MAVASYEVARGLQSIQETSYLRSPVIPNWSWIDRLRLDRVPCISTGRALAKYLAGHLAYQLPTSSDAPFEDAEVLFPPKYLDEFVNTQGAALNILEDAGVIGFNSKGLENIGGHLLFSGIVEGVTGTAIGMETTFLNSQTHNALIHDAEKGPEVREAINCKTNSSGYVIAPLKDPDEHFRKEMNKEWWRTATGANFHGWINRGIEWALMRVADSLPVDTSPDFTGKFFFSLNERIRSIALRKPDLEKWGEREYGMPFSRKLLIATKGSEIRLHRLMYPQIKERYPDSNLEYLLQGVVPWLIAREI